MPRFKAVNVLMLLLPGEEEGINRVRKLDAIPSDYDDLPWIHKRTDKTFTGRLEIQDTVILMIEVAGYHEIYEISCEMDDGEEAEYDMVLLTFNGRNN